MAIHELFSNILLIQTYHSTCVSFSCEFNKNKNYVEDSVNIDYSYHTGYLRSLIRAMAVQSLDS